MASSWQPTDEAMVMAEKKTRGRPRLDRREVVGSPEEEILEAAARLFTANGFAGTSTRQIAAEAGLQGPSIFHYFPTKEDLLRALADRALVRPLAVLEEIIASGEPPAVALYRVVRFHVAHMCSQPVDLTPMLQDGMRLPRDRFENFYQAMDRYSAGIRSLVEAGIRSGVFVDTDPVLATMSILGMGNWTVRWFRPDGPRTGAEVADTFARYALRSILSDPDEVEVIARQAEAADVETSASL
jgi:AcrR family transcriptional regulator